MFTSQFRALPGPERHPNSRYRGLRLWWPLKDGPGIGGAGAATYNAAVCHESVFSTAFTSATQNAAIKTNDIEWIYDPRVGGFCVNAARSSPQILQTNTNNSEVNTVNVGQNFTIGVWAYLNSFTTVSGFGPVVFSHGTAGNFNCYLHLVSPTFGQHPRLAFSISAVLKFVDGASLIQLKRWNFIVGTYDGVTMNVYWNGSLDGSLAQTGTPDAGVATNPWLAVDYQPSGAATDGRMWGAFMILRTLTAHEVKRAWLERSQLLR